MDPQPPRRLSNFSSSPGPQFEAKDNQAVMLGKGGPATSTLTEGHTSTAEPSTAVVPTALVLYKRARQQSFGALAPGEEVVPLAQRVPALEEAGQYHPGAQSPLHSEVERLAREPNTPAGQGRGAELPAGQ